LYARYSTDKQNPSSIEDQIYKCEQYAWDRRWTVLQNHVYSDAEITGATLERPGLIRLLAAAECPSRPIDAILCEDTSRLSRKLADVLNLSERLTFEGDR
jgi:DNA invertase Pin-like site-specific DNA recombinase